MDEIKLLEKQLKLSKCPEELKERGFKLLSRLDKMHGTGNYSAEYDAVEKYISVIVSIPYGKLTDDNLDAKNVLKVLDSHHFGLNEVKNRIVEYISVMKLNEMKGEQQKVKKSDLSQDMAKLTGSSSRAPVLCFVGVQGIGKTTFAKSLSQALNRNFVRVSMNAMGSVSQIKGAPKSAIGSEPGQILKALIRSDCMNPLILLDEIDKVSGSEDKRFDFLAATMEVLDPEQNGSFMDQYLDYPLDLSQVFFICTANTLGTLSAALLDRLEIIRFSSYSDEEKQHIARDYLVPKIREATGLGENELTFSDDVWALMIRPLGFDAGIRQLKRNLINVARRVARQIVEGEVKKVEINPSNFRVYIPEDIGIYS